jgi:hypothetical protein
LGDFGEFRKIFADCVIFGVLKVFGIFLDLEGFEGFFWRGSQIKVRLAQ